MMTVADQKNHLREFVAKVELPLALRLMFNASLITMSGELTGTLYGYLQQAKPIIENAEIDEDAKKAQLKILINSILQKFQPNLTIDDLGGDELLKRLA